MKRYILCIVALLNLSGLLVFTGCEDIQDEIKELNLSRYLAPIDFNSTIINRTNARFSWKENPDADNFILEIFENDENMQFEGTPVITVDDLTNESIPYLVASGLKGETIYSARIKAVGDDNNDSKWSSLTFETNSEQIVYALDNADLTSGSYIMRWPAGEYATHVTVTPGNLTYDVTETNIADGSILLDGLTPETAYTARLMNGTASRGSVSFTTLIDLGDAIIVEPGDNLAEILSAAEAGDQIAFMPGLHFSSSALQVNKDLTFFSAKPSEETIVSAQISISDGASLILQDLTFEGEYEGDSKLEKFSSFITYSSGNTYGGLTIENCTIRNYVSRFIYSNQKATIVQNITINNSIILNMPCSGADLIDFRNGQAANMQITNSTFANCATERDFFRLDGNGDIPVALNLLIDHCTFYDVINKPTSSTNRWFYIRQAGSSTRFNNSIIVNTEGIKSPQGNVTESTGNNYYNATNLLESIGGSAYTYDPGFVNPANYDFTVTHEEIRILGIGDPRWLQ